MLTSVTYKWAILFWFCIQIMSVGLIMAVIGPTLTELTIKFHTTYDDISYAIGAKGIGAIIGGPLGGLLVDHMQRHLLPILTLILIFKAVAVTVIPYCVRVWLMGIMWGCVGLTYNLIQVAGETYLMMLWKDKAGGPMLFAFSMCSFIKVIAPFIFVPFVSAPLINSGYISKKSHYNQTFVLNNSKTYDGMVQYPYIICGSLVFICAAVLAIIWACSISFRREIGILEAYRGSEEQNGTEKVPRIFSFFIVIFMFFYAIVSNITMQGSTDYLFSISISNRLKFSFDEAKILTSIQSLAAMLGRLISIIVLKFCTALALQNTALILSTIIYITMTCVGLYGHTSFWMTSVLFWLTFGPIIPITLPYVACVYPVNGFLVGMICVGYGIGRILANWITGVVFEYFGSRAVLLELSLSTAMCFIISISILLFWLKVRGKNKSECEESSYPLLDNSSDSE